MEHVRVFCCCCFVCFCVCVGGGGGGNFICGLKCTLSRVYLHATCQGMFFHASERFSVKGSFTCSMSWDFFLSPCIRKVSVKGSFTCNMSWDFFLSPCIGKVLCQGLFTCNMSSYVFPCIRKVLCQGFIHMQHVMGFLSLSMHQKGSLSWVSLHGTCHGRVCWVFPMGQKGHVLGTCLGICSFFHGSTNNNNNNNNNKRNKEVTGKERSLFIFRNCLLAHFFFSFVYLSSLLGSVSHLFLEKTSTVKILNFLFVSVSCFCLVVFMGWGGRGWG